MPTYCYKKPDGGIIEEVFPRGEAPEGILTDNGRLARRCYQAEHAGRRRSAGSGWPLTCVASGVNAEQAGELYKFLKDAGVPTEVTRDGDPVYRDPHHRKRALRARGMFDKSAYC